MITEEQIKNKLTEIEKKFQNFKQNIQPQSGQYEGQLFYDKTNKKMKVWNSKEWEVINGDLIINYNKKTRFPCLINFNASGNEIYSKEQILLTNLNYISGNPVNKITLSNNTLTIAEDGLYYFDLRYRLQLNESSHDRSDPDFYHILKVVVNGTDIDGQTELMRPSLGFKRAYYKEIRNIYYLKKDDKITITTDSDLNIMFYSANPLNILKL